MKTKRLLVCAMASILTTMALYGCNGRTTSSESATGKGSASGSFGSDETVSGSLLTEGDYGNIDMSEEVDLVISVFGTTTPQTLQ